MGKNFRKTFGYLRKGQTNLSVLESSVRAPEEDGTDHLFGRLEDRTGERIEWQKGRTRKHWPFYIFWSLPTYSLFSELITLFKARMHESIELFETILNTMVPILKINFALEQKGYFERKARTFALERLFSRIWRYHITLTIILKRM